jgi:hypothetical protein
VVDALIQFREVMLSAWERCTNPKEAERCSWLALHADYMILKTRKESTHERAKMGQTTGSLFFISAPLNVFCLSYACNDCTPVLM